MNKPKPKYYQNPTYKHVYGLDIATPVGRLVYPSLIVPKAFKGKEGQTQEKNSAPRYEANILIEKSHPDVAGFIKNLKEMTDGMLEVFNKGRSMKISDLEVLTDGDIQYNKDNEKYEFYKDKWVVVARNVDKPKTIDKNGDIDAGVFEGGMKVKGLVTPMITTHGVSFKLRTLKYVGDDGERFGGGARDQSSLLNDGDDEAEAFTPEKSIDEVLDNLGGSSEEESAPAAKGKKSRSQELTDSL